jgi:beta-mannanase
MLKKQNLNMCILLVLFLFLSSTSKDVFSNSPNMIINGDFSGGTTDWNLTAQLGGEAACSIKNGELHVQITKGGEHNWSVILNQVGLHIEYGESYLVSFCARCEAESREITVKVGMAREPWTAYSGYKTYRLTPPKKMYSFPFVMHEKTDANAFIEFQLGKNDTDVYLDDIELVQTSNSDEKKSSIESSDLSTYKIKAESGCFHGVFVGGTLAHDAFGLGLLPGFEARAGKGVRIVMTFIAWGMNSSFPEQECNRIIGRGSYPMITWEPWNYKDNKREWNHAAVLSGKYDAYILKWARAIKNWGKSIFLRPMHEMNGNWYPWCVNHNGNTYVSFIAVWKYLVDKFNAVGAYNVTWVWCPGNVSLPSSNSIKRCYPGDEYVDWLGVDGYNFGTSQAWGSKWESFREMFKSVYNEITGLSRKPLMIGEFASSEIGGNKANWISDALGSQLKNNYKRIKAVVWFNIDKETDWRIESSPEAQNAYKKAIADNYYLSDK